MGHGATRVLAEKAEQPPGSQVRQDGDHGDQTDALHCGKPRDNETRNSHRDSNRPDDRRHHPGAPE